jgi:condensin complex subunit 2
VDPLFRKTRAEFDEGGAMGLLMNHLGVDSKMRVVLDSGDSNILDEEEEEPDLHQTIDLSEIRGGQPSFLSLPQSYTEISAPSASILPSLDTLENRSIAQGFSDFRFSSDPKDLDFTFANKTHDEPRDHSFDNISAFGGGDDDGDGGFGGDLGEGGADVQDFFTGDQAVGDDVHDSGGIGFGNTDYDGEGAGPSVGGVSGVSTIGGVEPFDPRRAPNERDLVMAMNDNDEDMLDYFDSNFMKNWAGPEHWKLRRAVKKRRFRLILIHSDLRASDHCLFPLITRSRGY